jgi:hypothetical protein
MKMHKRLKQIAGGPQCAPLPSQQPPMEHFDLLLKLLKDPKYRRLRNSFLLLWLILNLAVLFQLFLATSGRSKQRPDTGNSWAKKVGTALDVAL